MRNLGQIDGSNTPELASLIYNIIKYHDGSGVLFDINGQVLAMEGHADLLQIPLTPNSTYVMGPHGEMVPFVAKAMVDNVIPPTRNSLMHIDAHRDNRREKTGRNGYKFQADKTAIRISDFIRSKGPDMAVNFTNLINSLLGDIETFLAALAPFNSEFAAFIREELEMDGYIVGPMHPDGYIDHYRKTKKPATGRPQTIAEVIRVLRPTIFSIDADVAGARREQVTTSDYVRDLFFAETIKTVFDGMKAELQLQKASQQNTGPIYAISVDPNWCTYPDKFLEEFIDRFYVQLMR